MLEKSKDIKIAEKRIKNMFLANIKAERVRLITTDGPGADSPDEIANGYSNALITIY